MSRVRTRGRNGPQLGQMAVEQMEDEAGNWLRPLPAAGCSCTTSKLHKWGFSAQNLEYIEVSIILKQYLRMYLHVGWQSAFYLTVFNSYQQKTGFLEDWQEMK